MKNTRQEIKLENVKVGNTVFIKKDSKTPYTVMEIATPCVMMLNNKTNFIVCYKTDVLYMDSNIQ